MKWNDKISLSLVAGIAIILPMSAFAEDQNQDQNKQGAKGGKGEQQGGKAGPQTVNKNSAGSGGRSYGGNAHASGAQGQVSHSSSGQAQISHASSTSATVQRTNVSSVNSQSPQTVSRHASSQTTQAQVSASQPQAQARQGRTQANSSQSAQVYSRKQISQAQAFSSPQYNRGNNYGGNWYPADSHSNWNQNQQYYWNNHNYQWYNGGWLIIDAGFNPYYANGGYSSGGSTVANVQSRLANQGYYRGPIDGDFGPGTRNAIANYQGDNGLRVTGHINDPLLQSLQLE